MQKVIVPYRCGLLLSALLFLLAFASCRSPVSSSSDSGAKVSNLKLSFIVQGSGSASGSRLLLPSASFLKVSLVPAGPDTAVPADQTADIPDSGGTSVVSLSFPRLASDTYTISAVAYAADRTTELFRQSATLSVSATTSALTLNLLPVDPTADVLDPAAIASFSPSLDGASSKSWRLSGIGSAGQTFTVRGDSASAVLIFLQTADGTLLNPTRTGGGYASAAVPAAGDLYLTLYNPGSTATFSLGLYPSTLYPGTIAANMVSILGGTFSSDGGVPQRVGDFSIGAYAVTQAQYLQYTGTNPSHFTGDLNRPVENVTWFDAVEFCNQLSLAGGLGLVYSILDRNPAVGYPIVSAKVTYDGTQNGYRLPTEAEWRWAASERGSGAFAFPGSDDAVSVSWTAANSGGATHAVGTRAPTAQGVYDMTGNVKQWCQTPCAVPVSAGSTTFRTQRAALGIPYSASAGYFAAGGNIADYLLYHRNYDPAGADRFTGFRVARGNQGAAVVTLAGQTAAGYSNATGSAAQFYSTQGVVTDPNNGLLYVTDSNNHVIRRVTAQGVVTTYSGAQTTSNSFSVVDGMASVATFGGSQGFAFDPSGVLWVGDSLPAKIRKVETDGSVSTLTVSGATLSWPNQIAVVGGTLYIANATTPMTISVVSAADGTATTIGPGTTFTGPAGIVADSTGTYLYVAEQTGRKIKRVTISDGTVATIAGTGVAGNAGGPGASATFTEPLQMAIDRDDRFLYVTDLSGYTIRRIDLLTAPVYTVTTVAGSAAAGSADGVGSAATFNRPFGIAFDSYAGNVLYVGDSDNNMVRKIILE